MNHFIALRGVYAAATERLTRDRLAAIGLPMKPLITGDEFVVLVRDGISEEREMSIVFDDGSFIICAGMFFYKDVFGLPGLRAYFQDFSPEKPRLDGTLGQFTLLIKKNDHLICLSDVINSNKIYHNEDYSVVSSLFVGVVETLNAASPDPQGCYEYAWITVTNGERTFLREVSALPSEQALRLDGGPRRVPLPALDLTDPEARDDDAEQALDRHLLRLRSLFAVYARAFGDRLSVSLSGGYDSRLILALLREAGVRPTLFTYRVSGANDHHIAEAIARNEGLEIEVVEKSVPRPVAPQDFPALTQERLGLFDGAPVDGLMEDGVDAADRRERVKEGRVKVNGGLGEIYRNFFYLPDRSYSLREIVWSFFSRYAPSACTSRFEPGAYEANLAEEIAKSLKSDSNRLDRRQVELVYPLFRGRFFSAREIPVNQTFGPCLFPFLEPCLIKGTCEIPIALKSYGKFESRLIRTISPALARCSSYYGFDFTEDPPLSYILKAQLTYRRPPWLRRYSYRLQWRSPGPLPFYLQPDYLETVIDTDFPFMRQFFNIAKVYDPDVLNRVATIEYVLQRIAGRRP